MIKVIKVYKDTRFLELNNLTIIGLGVEEDNKVDTLRFQFDELVVGQGELLTDLIGSDGNPLAFPLTLNEEEKAYDLLITSDLLVNDVLTFQLQIVNNNQVVWHSEQAKLNVLDTLSVADTEMPTTISNWLINADSKLNQYDLDEQQRKSNEETRISNENTRISNENSRVSAEELRAQAETERQQYYQTIKEEVDSGGFNGKDALINGVNTLNIVGGTNISLQQEDTTLTIENTYDDNQIKADIEKINRDLTNYSLITETGSKVALNINPNTYVMTLELKDKNNNTISSNEVDLPLETMVVGATYNNETKEIELTLQNGTEVSFSVADLVSGLVNENDLTTKLNDYALKTSIPTKTSQLNNDSGFIDKSVNNLKNYYKKTEIDTKVQAINTTTNSLNTRLTTAERNIETNTTDIKDLSNRTKRIETDIFDSGEATGTGINLQDSTLAEFQEVKVDGVGNQVTTNGNQILDFANPSFKSVGVTSTFENDILKIIGSSGAAYQSAFWNVAPTFLENNKGKTIGYKNKSANVSNKEAKSLVQVIVYYNDDTPTLYTQIYNFVADSVGNRYTIPQDVSNINRIVIGLYTNNSGSTEIENTITIEEPLLYFDDNDTYEPYTGGEPSPSPDYKQPIEVITEDFDLVSCGNNLLDMSNLISTITTNGITLTNNQDGTFSVEGTATANTNFSLLYNTLNNILKSGKYYYLYSSQQYDASAFNLSVAINTDNGTKYYIGNKATKNEFNKIITTQLSLYIPSGQTINAQNVKVMLVENNNSDNDYEPYTETRQTITMPEGEFAGKIDDTYKDQFRINYNEEDGKYHLYLDKNIGKDVFDGDETWGRTQGVTYFRYRSKLSKKPKMTGYNRGICLSNYFIYNNDYPTDKIGTIFSSVDGNCYIYPKEQDSVEQFKQWLSTHNTEVYYVLAEPYTLDLGVVNMPLSYYPITNVYNTCVGIPNMYVKYYRDFKKTITTMQVDIQELKSTIQELTSNQTELLSQINTIKENQVVEEESEVVTQ